MAVGRDRAPSSRLASASPPSCGSTPSSRRTASADSIPRPSSAARRCWRRWSAASPLARRPRRKPSTSTRRTAWVDSKLTPQPNGVALQPIALTGARERVAKKTYIRAPRYPQPAFDKALAECKADTSWRTFEIADSGHDVMVDAPGWLVDHLLNVS